MSAKKAPRSSEPRSLAKRRTSPKPPKRTTYCVGVDVADRSFTTCILHSQTGSLTPSRTFKRTPSGCDNFIAWLRAHNADEHSTLVAMETTGVLSQLLCYTLAAQGYRVTVIDAARIGRTRPPSRPKSDAADCALIADYLARHLDQITLWKPVPPVLQELNAMAAARELLVKSKTQFTNQKKSFAKAFIVQDGLLATHDATIEFIAAQIKEIDRKMRTLLTQHPELAQMVKRIDSVPGAGLLMGVNLLIATKADETRFQYRALANYLGICPHEHSSGTSVRKKPRSSRLGSPRVRKLLTLAARSVVTHNQHFRRYYLQKLHEGKPKMVAINNVANKLLKIICAVVQHKTMHQKNYRPTQIVITGS